MAEPERLMIARRLRVTAREVEDISFDIEAVSKNDSARRECARIAAALHALAEQVTERTVED